MEHLSRDDTGFDPDRDMAEEARYPTLTHPPAPNVPTGEAVTCRQEPETQGRGSARSHSSQDQPASEVALPLELQSLPPAVQAKLRAALHERTAGPGEPIFHQDAATDTIYWLLRGRIKISRVTPEGYESVLCVRNPGESFCPVTALDGGPQLGTAVALDFVHLAWLERKAFNDLCQEHPELAAVVQRACLFEVRRLMHRLETFAFRNVEQRLALVLLTEMRRSGGRVPAELRLTRQELAGLAGTTRESISRTLQRLQRAGVLRARRGAVTILDPERLRRIVRLAPGGDPA